jgi:hypothetical protein
MRPLSAPSLPSPPRRPLRLVWTVIAVGPTTSRLTSRWVVETELVARAA